MKNSKHLLATLTGVALGIVAGNLIYKHVIAPKTTPDETPEGAGEEPEEMAGESKEKKQEESQAKAPTENEIPIHVTSDNTKEAGDTPDKVLEDAIPKETIANFYRDDHPWRDYIDKEDQENGNH